MTELNSESMPDATASTEANPSKQNEAKAPLKKPSGAKTQESAATKSKASAKSSSASKKSAKPASKRPAKATSKSAASGTKASKSSQTKKASSSVKPSAAPQTNPEDVFRSISTPVQAASNGASDAISNVHSDARAAQSSSDRAPLPADSLKAADPSSVVEGKNAAVPPSPQEERQTAASSLADGEPKRLMLRRLTVCPAASQASQRFAMVKISRSLPAAILRKRPNSQNLPRLLKPTKQQKPQKR